MSVETATPTDAPNQSASAPAPAPWMTVKEAAGHARRHERTIRNALHLYVTTKGKQGLLGHQGAANCTWRIRRVDLDAWIAGQPQGRRRSR